MATFQEFVFYLKQQGFDLVLIWMLSMAIIYGILTKIKMPESYSARAIISISSGFLIMLVSVGSALPLIIEHIVASLIVVGFVLFLIVIFLELLGIKSSEVISRYSTIALIIAVGLALLIFLGSGATSLFSFGSSGPSFDFHSFLSNTTLSTVIFLVIISLIVWIFSKEEKGG